MTRAPKPPENHALTVALAVLILVAGGGFAWWNHARLSSPPRPVAATASPVPSRAPASAKAKPAPSPSCTLTVSFDYIVRDDDPGASVLASDIGNVDYDYHGKCVPALSSFAATAGQAPGECTTIALASDNPGYNVGAVPAPPLRDVIESAGPGC